MAATDALTVRFLIKAGSERPATELDIVVTDPQQQISVGRDASCNLVLPSPSVSRRHATILVKGMEVFLRDHSANGCTLADGRHLVENETALELGETFTLGPYELAVASFRFSQVDETVAVDVPPELPKAPGKVPPQQAAPRVTVTPPVVAEQPVVQPLVGSGGRAALDDEFLEYQTEDVDPELRRRIRRLLLDRLDLAKLDRTSLNDERARPKVREALGLILRELRSELPEGLNVERFLKELADEALGLGPLEVLLADDRVSEIMVVDDHTIFAEAFGRLSLTGLRFTDEESTRAVIERIVTPLGRRIDESTPLVDARLKDGSRVNAVIRPLALKGPCITIRKFSKKPFELRDLIRFGSLTEEMGRFLTRSVAVRKNILVCGGTGSGKTTLLNVLSAAIPHRERVVTVEDAAELRLNQTHVVSLETRPPNMEGKGAITIRDLVKNALRMRPDRIIVGECRGGEALDMLQAMNTGHDGSMTTVHANSPAEALARLETLALMSGLDLPSRAIREQIAQSIHLVAYQARLSDGSRRVTAISEVLGIDGDQLELAPIFEYVRLGTGDEGRILGEYRPTGYLPTYLDDFITHGLVDDGQYI